MQDIKYWLKRTLWRLRLTSFARSIRDHIGYPVFDFFGFAIFVLLRTCRLLPKIEKFDKDKIKKILIIRPDRIGDVILSTPAVRAVRNSYPQAEIHLLVSEYTKDLVVNNKNVDRLLISKKNELSRDYDLSIALPTGLKENYLTFISGAKFRIGYVKWGGGFFLTHPIKDDRAIRVRHEVESALEAVGLAGCRRGDLGLDISITEEGEGFAEDFFKKNNLHPNELVIGIHPGARQPYIRWGKERFAEVADNLIKDKHAKIVLIGSGHEERLVRDTALLMGEKPVFAIGQSLTQIISVIKRCKLFVGNSTGPMHIAAALKVPVVAIFGAVHNLDSYREWGPWNDNHIIVSKDLNCRGCHPAGCRSFDCMRLIKAEDVLRAAKEILSKSYNL